MSPDETTAQATAAATEPSKDKSFGYKLADAGDLDVDFAQLKSINNDIYGWIYIPNTNVDYNLLTGKLICAHCGLPFYRKDTVSRKGMSRSGNKYSGQTKKLLL